MWMDKIHVHCKPVTWRVLICWEKSCKSQFSLVIDESIDLSCTKHLCLVVRTLLGDKVADCFLGLIALQDATASALYDVINFLADNHILYKEYMIGFGTNGAKSMLGAHNFAERHIALFVMECICQSFTLCDSYACATLPNDVKNLALDVFLILQV